MNIGEECSLEDSQQESYMGGTTRSMTGNIGIEWKETGENRREQRKMKMIEEKEKEEKEEEYQGGKIEE